MQADADQSRLNETDCPSKPAETGFTCNECKTSFTKPLLTTVSNDNQTQTYYACPRCLTEISSAVPTEKERKNLQKTSTSEPERTVPEPIADTNCQHFFGYLNKRAKEEPFPEECLTCKKMIECMYR
jgi:DNA-directed RNA polymerase subunit RPC12/RpoP